MNDISNPSQSDDHMPQSDPANSLTAEQYEEFLEAVDILYIHGNLSGRLKFLEKWPVAGRMLFSEELIAFDHDGVSDLERRKVLEEEAEERRLEILDIVKTVHEKSVEKSVLQVEYVEGIVKKLGRDLALLLYAPKIVDRFIPPLPKPIVDDVADDQVAGSDSSTVSNDPLQSSSGDVDSIASDLVPDLPKGGAPSAANPIVDVPEPPKNPVPKSPEEAAQANNIPDPFAESKAATKQPIVPEIDDSMDAVQPISVEPPPQRPVPEDIQEAAAQQNPETVSDVPSESATEATPEQPQSREPTRPPLPAEPTRPPLPEPEDNENVFLGRDPYAPEEPKQVPPSEPIAPQAPASSDPVNQDVSRPAVHKALDGAEPIASQKMTFMPAKKPEAAKTEKASIPVIGGNKDKPPE